MNPHWAAAAATDLGRRPPTTNSIAVNRQFERCGELSFPLGSPRSCHTKPGIRQSERTTPGRPSNAERLVDGDGWRAFHMKKDLQLIMELTIIFE